jgi:hypothetical protein
MSDRPVVWTPEALRERARRMHAAVLAFQADMADAKHRGVLPDGDPQLAAWRGWRDAWSKWYADTTESTWWWGGTGATLDEFSTDLEKWRRWFVARFERPASGVVPEATRAVPIADVVLGRGSGPGATIGLVVGAAVLAFVIARVTR